MSGILFREMRVSIALNFKAPTLVHGNNVALGSEPSKIIHGIYMHGDDSGAFIRADCKSAF